MPYIILARYPYDKLGYKSAKIEFSKWQTFSFSNLLSAHWWMARVKKKYARSGIDIELKAIEVAPNIAAVHDRLVSKVLKQIYA